MKKTSKSIFLVLGLVAALVSGYLLGQSDTSPAPPGQAEENREVAGSEKAKTQFTCGMHPFIIQDEPGTCPICGMNLTPLKAGSGGSGAPVSGERKVTMWKSPMDPTYVRQEPGKDPMGHDLVPVYEEGTGGRAISIDPVTAQNMGVRTAVVTREDIAREIRAVGRVGFEEARQSVVNSKIGGWVERLYVNETGQHVKKGQPLMEIYSPELVSAQEEYLLAVRNRMDLAGSRFADIAAGGERLAQAARQRLKYWDISEKQIETLEKTGKVRKTMTLYSPFNGIVTEKKVFEGMNVMPGADLLQLADISEVWVYADLYEYELPWVKEGQEAQVEIPYADRTIQGRVDYIYPTVEAQTRTIKVRIALSNPGFELKPEMFANVRLKAQSAPDVLTVPAEAVLNSGTGQHVFVALGDGKFEPRQVKIGLQGENDRVQIVEGVKEGEEVVTSAQFMLDSESKLREAIQKMMEPKKPRSAPAGEEGAGGEELDDLFGGGTTGQATKEDLEDLF